MKTLHGALTGIAILAFPGTAVAQAACPANLVCASDPQTVVKAIQAAGYKAQIGKDGVGDPKIDSSASGYNFTVNFYGCTENKNCTSLRFAVLFKNDGTNTPALANAWNKKKRFSQMGVQDDGELAFAYDVTTVGGLNQTNFADVIDWWQYMLSEVRTFFSQQ